MQLRRHIGLVLDWRNSKDISPLEENMVRKYLALRYLGIILYKSQIRQIKQKIGFLAKNNVSRFYRKISTIRTISRLVII